MKMKIYYAHSLHIYNTFQEERDIELLKSLGFEVFNPNQPFIQLKVKKAKEEGDKNYMKTVFYPILDVCDGIAFRAHTDGKIPAGVAFEVLYMKEKEKPIIELPCLLNQRILSVEDTTAILAYNGQR